MTTISLSQPEIRTLITSLSQIRFDDDQSFNILSFFNKLYKNSLLRSVKIIIKKRIVEFKKLNEIDELKVYSKK